MRVDLNSLYPRTALEGKTSAIWFFLRGYLRKLALYASFCSRFKSCLGRFMLAKALLHNWWCMWQTELKPSICTCARGKLDPHFARKQGKERHVTCPRCITRKHNGISNSILVIWKAKTKPFCAMWVPDNIMAWKESTSAKLWIEDACQNKIIFQENNTRKRKSNDIPPKHQNKKSCDWENDTSETLHWWVDALVCKYVLSKPVGIPAFLAPCLHKQSN